MGKQPTSLATGHNARRRKVHIKGSFTFPNREMAALIGLAMLGWAKEVRTLYGQKTGEGFWLVGDHGVYLMHNGAFNDQLKQQPVVYAAECNPETTEDWWEVKRDIFGGDDGCDFIGRATVQAIVEAGLDVEIGITVDNKLLIRPKGVTVQ